MASIEEYEDTGLQIEELFAKEEGYSWGYAYVKSRQEKKLASKLTAKSIQNYLPLIRTMRIHHRGKVYTDLPMLPGYLFVCIDSSRSLDIKCQNEVVTFDLFDGLTESAFIKDLILLRKFEIFSQNRNVIVNPGIQAGSTVMIKTGALQNTEVVVLERRGEVSVIVNLHFLGRSCECVIQADELKLLI